MVRLVRVSLNLGLPTPQRYVIICPPFCDRVSLPCLVVSTSVGRQGRGAPTMLRLIHRPKSGWKAKPQQKGHQLVMTSWAPTKTPNSGPKPRASNVAPKQRPKPPKPTATLKQPLAPYDVPANTKYDKSEQGGAPPVISWFIIPITIDITPLNRSCSTYKPFTNYLPTILQSLFVLTGLWSLHAMFLCY